MKFTWYYDNVIRTRRPEVLDEWLVQALKDPIHVELQLDGRIRRYIYLDSHHKYLRVVFEGEMVHNAFFDRGFKPKRQ